MTNSEGGFELVLGNRQLVTAMFAVTIQTGLVAGLAYVAGRSIAATTKPESAQVVVVDSASAPPIARKPTPAPPAQPVASPKPAAESWPVVAPPARTVLAAVPASVFDAPRQGELYLQIAAVDRGVAEVFAEVLTRKGFTPRVAPGIEPKIFRVMVGPITGRDQLPALQAELTTAGFTSFPRRF